MILVAEEGVLRLVAQADHARLGGEMLALFRAFGLPDHRRRDDLLFAAREHDNGWRETDAAPRVDPRTGRPYDFVDQPRDDRIELWLRGVRRFCDARPYAALLILRHARALHDDRRKEEPWQAFFASLEQLEQDLLAETGAPPAEVESDYRWIALSDALALAVAAHRREPFSSSGISARFAGDTLHLAPFPLAGTTTFRLPCRTVPDRRYLGDADFAGELAGARWTKASYKVAPEEEPA